LQLQANNRIIAKRLVYKVKCASVVVQNPVTTAQVRCCGDGGGGHRGAGDGSGSSLNHCAAFNGVKRNYGVVRGLVCRAMIPSAL
jgi:hypothetical protein